jgi:murein L,D-transpeptidase YcbB/YkuD
MIHLPSPPARSRLLAAAALVVLAMAPVRAVLADGDGGAVARLQRALADYQAIAAQGGWPTVQFGPLLRVGDVSNRIPALRRRLAATADLAAGPPNSSEFDAAVDAAVRRFQARHGLETDGIVGPKTLAALNVSATDRVAILAEAVRRARVGLANQPRRAVVVNVPAAELDVVEDGHTVLQSRVIVGRTTWPTPLITGKITALVINPYWVVPPNIARRELLPKQRRDPNYLDAHDIRVFSDWTAQAAELDPHAVDWTNGQARRGLKLRQDPGPKNPLGRVKFLFANPFDVYLHDTPNVDLFERSARTLSHGCIRVEKAMDLARYLLRGDPAWPPDVFEQAVANGENRRIDLRHPITVTLISRIAWVAPDGTVQFRRDPYGRDSGTRPPPESRVCTPDGAFAAPSQ